MNSEEPPILWKDKVLGLAFLALTSKIFEFKESDIVDLFKKNNQTLDLDFYNYMSSEIVLKSIVEALNNLSLGVAESKKAPEEKKEEVAPAPVAAPVVDFSSFF